MGTEYTLSKKHNIVAYEMSSQFTLSLDRDYDDEELPTIARHVTCEEAIEIATQLLYITSFNMRPGEWDKAMVELKKKLEQWG